MQNRSSLILSIVSYTFMAFIGISFIWKADRYEKESLYWQESAIHYSSNSVYYRSNANHFAGTTAEALALAIYWKELYEKVSIPTNIFWVLPTNTFNYEPILIYPRITNVNFFTNYNTKTLK